MGEFGDRTHQIAEGTSEGFRADGGKQGAVVTAERS
jgi:hypothetical protein